MAQGSGRNRRATGTAGLYSKQIYLVKIVSQPQDSLIKEMQVVAGALGASHLWKPLDASWLVHDDQPSAPRPTGEAEPVPESVCCGTGGERRQLIGSVAGRKPH